MSKVQELIEQYQLSAHPEGGYFRETYRSDVTITSPLADSSRNAVTQIYFLLGETDVSRFHKVLHDEIWHFYHGAPLRLLELTQQGCKEIYLGGEAGSFHHVIKGGHYQAAESTGEYTLMGCTVAPGFDFSDFTFLVDEPGGTELISRTSDSLKKFI